MDFSTTDTTQTTKEVTITFTVPEKDCIYKDFITCSAHEPHITVSPWKADKETTNHYDSSFKETKPAFNETFSITMTANTTKNPSTGHLYCTYYRKSDKRINHAIFSFSFPEISHNEEEIPDAVTNEIKRSSNKKQTISPKALLDDYIHATVAAITNNMYEMKIDFKSYITTLILLMILLCSVVYFCQTQLPQHNHLRESLEVTLATLMAICCTSFLVRFYTPHNALVILAISCLSSFIAGLLYIKKSTELAYKPLRTFCSCVGMCLIISTLLLAFKLLQCADEKFGFLL